MSVMQNQLWNARMMMTMIKIWMTQTMMRSVHCNTDNTWHYLLFLWLESLAHFLMRSSNFSLQVTVAVCSPVDHMRKMMRRPIRFMTPSTGGWMTGGRRGGQSAFCFKECTSWHCSWFPHGHKIPLNSRYHFFTPWTELSHEYQSSCQ